MTGTVAPAGPTVTLVSTEVNPGVEFAGGGGGAYWTVFTVLACAAVAVARPRDRARPQRKGAGKSEVDYSL